MRRGFPALRQNPAGSLFTPITAALIEMGMIVAPKLARSHRIGRGRRTIYTIHAEAARGIDYGVGFCGGAQERARRAKRSGRAA